MCRTVAPARLSMSKGALGAAQGGWGEMRGSPFEPGRIELGGGLVRRRRAVSVRAAWLLTPYLLAPLMVRPPLP